MADYPQAALSPDCRDEWDCLKLMHAPGIKYDLSLNVLQMNARR